MQTLAKISQQTIWQLIGKIITSLSAILILSIVSQNYGERLTGVFTLTLLYLSIFYLLADFGINAYIISLFQKDNLQSVWQRLLGLRMILITVLVISALIGSLVWPEILKELQLSIWLGVLAILGYGLYVTAASFFQFKLRYDLLTAATISGVPLIVAIIYFATMSDLPVWLLSLGYSIGWLVTGSVAIYLASRYISILPLIETKFIKQTLLSVWPIAAALFLNILYFRIDAFMLSFMIGFADAGVYNVAYQVFQSILVVPTFIMNSFYPILLIQFDKNKKEFFELFSKGFGMLGLIGILGLFITYLLSSSIINLITGGDGFAGSTESLNILAVSLPAFFLTSLLMWFLIILKRYYLMLAIYGFGLILNICLNYLFIPKYSFIAASLTTVVTEYIVLIIQLYILLPLLLKYRK